MYSQLIDIPQISLKNVTLSGSNAAYTYTEHSDLDLHLVVDIPSAAQWHKAPGVIKHWTQKNDILVHVWNIRLCHQNPSGKCPVKQFQSWDVAPIFHVNDKLAFNREEEDSVTGLHSI